MKRVGTNVFVFLLVVFISFSSLGQVITTNDGFEGNPAQYYFPPNWYNCDDDMSSGDMQPGKFHNNLAPSQGATYISLVTREIDVAGTVETAYADLLIPFENDKCYNFTVDLTLSHEFYATNGWTDYYFDNPCVLQIFGFNGNCDEATNKELLWTSEVISNFSWQTFHVSVKPLADTYHKIAIRPFFTPAYNLKNTALMIDNLQYPISPDNYTDQGGLLTLPSTVTDINWYYNGQLVPGANSADMPFMGNGVYTARFFDENGCLVMASGNFNVNTDEFLIYPNPTNELVAFEYFSFDNIPVTVDVFDDQGKLIKFTEYETIKGKNKIRIDLRSLATGLYLIKILRPASDPVLSKTILIRD